MSTEYLEKQMMNNGVVVVGGGAAGMMAAIWAAERCSSVSLLEPNERLGKKLNITGKGRCNVTNCADTATLIANTTRNGKFLYSAFSQFDGHAAIRFFEKIGVPLKVERGNRVFPISDRAFDVSSALERQLKALRVNFIQDRAAALKTDGNAVCGVQGAADFYPAKAIILATGGASYPGTGSTGEGYAMAAMLGHTVTPLRASLVPLEGILGPGIPCARLQGLSLRNIGLTAYEGNKKVYSDFGELLFTHFGVSGPIVLSASAHLKNLDKIPCHLDLDLKPALDTQRLDRRILSDFSKYANLNFQNALKDLLPQKLIPVVVKLSGIPGEIKVHDITREQRQTLERLLKHFSVEIISARPIEEAIVTSGGVSVREVNPKTMESKLVKGLYFAGEILDVDAYTGGFNLQIAWATGRLAGISAANQEMEEVG